MKQARVTTVGQCDASNYARLTVLQLALGLAIVWVASAAATVRAGQPDEVFVGLPLVAPAIADTQEHLRAELGRRLFSELQLSRDDSISCASCHRPDHAFSDGRPLARGIGGRLGTRNTPSLFNVVFNTTEFWDGRRSSLESQALDPLTNPIEHGLRNEGELLKRLLSDPSYVAEFRAAFAGDPNAVSASHVAQAFASFERTLIAGNSQFDRYFYKHDSKALDVYAERGLALFRGRAQCASCHMIGQRAALFTDNDFHSVNLSLPPLGSKLAALTTEIVRVRNAGTPIGALILGDADAAELGRFVVTLDPADIGKFRTPSIRNVALTAPYMHDGSVATLEEAVDRELYDRVGQAGRPLIFTPEEKRDLVAFLNSLTSPVAARSYKADVTPIADSLQLRRSTLRTDRTKQRSKALFGQFLRLKLGVSESHLVFRRASDLHHVDGQSASPPSTTAAFSAAFELGRARRNPMMCRTSERCQEWQRVPACSLE